MDSEDSSLKSDLMRRRFVKKPIFKNKQKFFFFWKMVGHQISKVNLKNLISSLKLTNDSEPIESSFAQKISNKYQEHE